MPGHDPKHWLHRLTAQEWLRAAMRELAAARASFTQHSARPALASARRAAGMGWNAVLALDAEPDPAFGRTYVDHLRALAEGPPLVSGLDASPIPLEVQAAARALMEDPVAQRRDVVTILTPRRDDRLIAAAETIAAEAYARVLRRDGRPSDR